MRENGCAAISMNIPHTTIASYPLRTGNAVRPLIDGVPTFRRIGEAIDEAKHSVWLTVAYYAPDFRMPDGRGSLFDVLDRATARGSVSKRRTSMSKTTGFRGNIIIAPQPTRNRGVSAQTWGWLPCPLR
jgi:phosphatidylserine/phosphatidylglycerophosphate/cardiolipin synthase-like enzyme